MLHAACWHDKLQVFLGPGDEGVITEVQSPVLGLRDLDTNKKLFCTHNCAVYEVQGLGTEQRIGPHLLCRGCVELGCL